MEIWDTIKTNGPLNKQLEALEIDTKLNTQTLD